MDRIFRGCGPGQYASDCGKFATWKNERKSKLVQRNQMSVGNANLPQKHCCCTVANVNERREEWNRGEYRDRCVRMRGGEETGPDYRESCSTVRDAQYLISLAPGWVNVPSPPMNTLTVRTCPCLALFVKGIGCP